jgi:hypothetical protein
MMDEMLRIIRVLRQKFPIQDHLMKMKMVKNCFSRSKRKKKKTEGCVKEKGETNERKKEGEKKYSCLMNKE